MYNYVGCDSVKKLKSIFCFLIVVGLGCLAVFITLDIRETARVNKIKEGWHIEVVNEYIKVREEPDQNSAELGKVEKGQVYKVDDYENHNGNFWYHVEYEKDKWGWVANPLGKDYLDDINNDDDIRAPSIKFYDDIYFVDSIDDISYDHLEVTDDKPGVTVTHKVYHEVNELENKDQYWILYIATDAAGKTAKRVQRIEFNNRPSESEVLDFSQLSEDRKVK